MNPRTSSAASRDHGEPQEATRPNSNLNIFSDDYAESFAESYADSIDARSIRRTSSRASLPERQTSRRDHSNRSGANTPGTISRQPSAHMTRSSIQKPQPHRSISEGDRYDIRQGIPLHPITTPNASQNPPGTTLRRSLSTNSSFAPAPSPMPASTGEGPTHAYTTYPQDLDFSRTASVATAATRPYSENEPSRTPAHPYGLYTQNVAEDGPAPVQQTIPVGFPGTSQQFHRRIGPEGEEQDIVGPNGHTEQLPPYSRYPEQTNPKTAAGVPSPLPAIGESNSTEEPRMTPADSSVVVADQSPDSSTAESEAVRPVSASKPPSSSSDKSWNEKSWREKRQTRLCGVPVWFFIFMSAALVLIAVICGAVIGSVVGSSPNRRQRQQELATATTDPGDADGAQTYGGGKSSTKSPSSLLDVQVVTSTPTGLLALPTGVFYVDPGSPVKDSAGCLPSSQQGAWSCGLPEDLVSVELDTSGTFPSMAFKSFDTDDVWYGVQPPNVDDSNLDLVTDSQLDTDTYAYHFQSSYNKFVILHEEELTLTPSEGRRRKRDSDTSTTTWDSMLSYNGKALDSQDHPWFCYWPKTFIEALVYVGNDSVVEGPQRDASGDDDGISNTKDSPARNPDSATENKDKTSGSSSTSTPSTPTADGESTVSASLEKNAAADVVITPAPNPLEGVAGDESNKDPNTLDDSTADSQDPTPAQDANTVDKRNDDAAVELCPRKIKIEERRVPNDNALPPTCTKMVSAPDLGPNRYRPWKNEQGLLVVLQLDESDPPSPTPTVIGRRQLMKRAPANACYCVWFSPYGTNPPSR